MIGSWALASQDLKVRYAGYDRIIGVVSWLLVALVSLYAGLFPLVREPLMLLAGCALALSCYRLASGRLLPAGELKAALDLVLLFGLVVTVCWCTGRTASPFVSFLYLVLMATSLTLGLRSTCLMAACAIAAYSLLASGPFGGLFPELAGRVINLLPFLLTAYLGTLLAREAEGARAEVERLSLTDDLTDLHNMRGFETLALQQEKLSKRYQKPFAVCMLDSDNLKQINDRHGHLAGTELIKWTAHLIRENIRECDIAARFGGDEFIVLYEGHDKERILPAVERILQAVAAHPFCYQGDPIDCTISAGVASFPEDGPDVRSVVMRADEAMYRSKRHGKNRVSLYRREPEGRTARGRGRTILPGHP